MKKLKLCLTLLLAAVLCSTAAAQGVLELVAGDKVVIEPARGKAFFVGSTVATASNDNSGRSPVMPLATLNAAIAKCTGSAGDIIYLLPKHAETISTAALSPALSVAGVTVIGLGNGEQRPTFTLTHIDAEVDVSAADVTLKNIIVKTGVDSQKIMLDINAKDCRVEDCEFREGSAIQSLVAIDITGAAGNACDRAKIVNCRFVMTADGPSAAIQLGEVADEVEIVGCFIDADADAASIHNPTGKILTNLLLKGNVVANRSTGIHAIELVSACTGFAVNNSLYADTATAILDPGALKCIGNRQVAAADAADVATPYLTGNGAPIGSQFTIVETITQSTIVAAGVALTGASSGGALELVSISVQNGATAAASAGTKAVAEFYTNNVSGSGVFATIAEAKLGANAVCGQTTFTTNLGPVFLEATKIISVKATTEDFTSAGVMKIYLTFRRVAAGATIAAAH